jgi:type II secretory pathway pseudopilin PulG
MAAMRQTRGFTVIEMMVVVTICLTMMMLVVPIFQVTTRTVTHVEEKLAVYEAARNILDNIEQEVRQAVTNERGEHFSIKACAYADTDKFTPDEDNNPGTLDLTRYKFSRREADCVNYIKPQTGAFHSNNGMASWQHTTIMDGAVSHPFNYPTQFLYKPDTHEAWFSSIRSSLLYQIPENDMGQLVVYGQTTKTRAQLLADVGLIETAMIFQARNNEPDYNAAGSLTWPNEPVNRLMVGNELKQQVRFYDWIDDYARKQVTGMNILDLAIAYWDDVDAKFYEPRDDSIVYFENPPKALRFTITVADANKRARVTLQRLVQIPVGMGSGVVTNSTGLMDSQYLLPAPYNRFKNLKSVEPGL